MKFHGFAAPDDPQPIIANSARCGAEFEQSKPGRGARRKYCSRACAGAMNLQHSRERSWRRQDELRISNPEDCK